MLQIALILNTDLSGLIHPVTQYKINCKWLVSQMHAHMEYMHFSNVHLSAHMHTPRFFHTSAHQQRKQIHYSTSFLPVRHSVMATQQMHITCSLYRIKYQCLLTPHGKAWCFITGHITNAHSVVSHLPAFACMIFYKIVSVWTILWGWAWSADNVLFDLYINTFGISCILKDSHASCICVYVGRREDL